MSAAQYIRVTGKVQGVGYRAFVEQTALKAGVTGWVRNRRDGCVEAVFVGDEATIAGVVEACRQGPPGSRIDKVEARAATEIERRGIHSFEMRTTV